jgi:hypothetical protein
MAAGVQGQLPLPSKGNETGKYARVRPPFAILIYNALRSSKTLEEAAAKAQLSYLQAWKGARSAERKRWITITKAEGSLTFAAGEMAWQGEVEATRFEVGSSSPQNPPASENREVHDGGIDTMAAFTSLLSRCLKEKGIGPARVHGAQASISVHSPNEAPLLNPDKLRCVKNWSPKGVRHIIFEVFDEPPYQVMLKGSSLLYNIPEQTIPATVEALQAWAPAAAIAARKKLEWAARALGMVPIGSVRIGGVNKRGVHLAIPGLARLLGLTGRVTAQAIGIWLDNSKGHPEVEFELQVAIILLSIPGILTEHDHRLTLDGERIRALEKRVKEFEEAHQ